ncbi:MAG: thioredoxin domain-containing protein [Patescibacteria group bacterium]
MRILILTCSLIFLASCTIGSKTTPSSVSGESVKSLISSDKYSPALQKTIPSPTFGSGKRNLTIYADFQCPACIAFSDALGGAFEAYAASGKTTITYKQFPLTSIHPNAYRDAIAGLCVAEQGKYMDGKKALYNLERAKAGAKVTDAERVSALAAIGADATELTQCLSENRYAKQVDDEVVAGDAVGVSGTPTVFLDGTKMELGIIFADPVKGQAFLDRVFSE